MRWLLSMDEKWRFLMDAEWRISPDANRTLFLICYIVADMPTKVYIKYIFYTLNNGRRFKGTLFLKKSCVFLTLLLLDKHLTFPYLIGAKIDMNA